MKHISYTYPFNTQVYTVELKNPRVHKQYQVKVHNQGSFPYVHSSFDNEKEAVRTAKKLILLIKKAEKKNQRIRL